MVTATDTDGLTDADQISFTVNGLPSSPLVSIEPDPAATNNALSASILNPSVDPEGATVTYSYVWLKDNVVQPSQTAQTVSAADTLKGEQWTVRVTPNDGLVDGPYGEATVSVQNTQPVVSSVGISPTSNLYNDSIYTCTATVIDPDETPVLSYQWALEGNPVGSNVNSLDLNGTGAMPDDLLSCTVTATDSDFATGVGSTSITLDNRAPVLSNLVIDPATGVTTSMALTCSVDVTDADGETLSSDFTWTVGTSTYVGPTLQLDPSMVVPNGAVVCTADVTDGYGGSDQASTSVVVVNTPPTVTAVTLSPSSDVRNGDTVTCLASTDDADNDPVTLSYAWTINGASAGTGATISLNTAVDGDLVQCQATALDSHGASGLGSAALTVDNTAPIVTSASINPTNPVSQTPTLTCTAVGMDADNDPVQFSYEWLIGTQSLSETSSTLAGPFPVSETVICRVTPNDGKSNGQPVDTSVTVDTTPPTVSSVTLSPGAVYTNDEIVAIAVFDDVDGQSVSASFDWHVVDFATGATTIVQSGPDTTLSGMVHFDRDDEVYVVVTPNDGVEDGISMTSSGVTVLNTPPTAPSVSASPDPASAGQDDLVCTVDVPGTDADTDVVYYTYEWTDPTGAVVQTTPSTAALSDTFAGTSTTEGMWTCTVTPDDGLPLGAIGPSDSTMVTVGSDCLLNGMVLYLPFDNGGLTDQSHFVHSVIAELSSSTADRYQNPKINVRTHVICFFVIYVYVCIDLDLVSS